jgi:hypothetical protein
MCFIVWVIILKLNFEIYFIQRLDRIKRNFIKILVPNDIIFVRWWIDPNYFKSFRISYDLRVIEEDEGKVLNVVTFERIYPMFNLFYSLIVIKSCFSVGCTCNCIMMDSRPKIIQNIILNVSQSFIIKGLSFKQWMEFLSHLSMFNLIHRSSSEVTRPIFILITRIWEGIIILNWVILSKT